MLTLRQEQEGCQQTLRGKAARLRRNVGRRRHRLIGQVVFKIIFYIFSEGRHQNKSNPAYQNTNRQPKLRGRIIVQ